jgi:hypothetical protein
VSTDAAPLPKVQSPDSNQFQADECANPQRMSHNERISTSS